MAKESRHLDLLRPGVCLAGRYKLLERVPRWVSQRRYRAQRLSDSQLLQILFFDLSLDEISDFSSSIEALATIHHPNLLSIHSAESLQGFSVFIAEYFEGPTLKERLEHEGAFSPEEARSIAGKILAAFYALESAEIPFPEINSDSIVLFQGENGWDPVLFPLLLPSGRSAAAKGIAKVLRDLLFEMCANRPPPSSYRTSELRPLPSGVRQSWQKLFVDFPEIEEVIEIIDTPISLILPKARISQPAIPIEPKPETVAEAEPEREPLAVRIPLPQEAAPIRQRTSRPPAPTFVEKMRQETEKEYEEISHSRINWQMISTFAAILTAGFVGWFCWSILQTLAPVHLPTPQAAPVAAPPPIAANKNTIDQKPKIEVEIEKLPSDPAGKPGSAMGEWLAYWQKYPSNSTVTTGLKSYLLAMEPQIEALRSGQLPVALAALEKMASGGFPPARYLLGQVLWGRESSRSEQLMVQLARSGHEQARAWCEKRFIDWKN